MSSPRFSFIGYSMPIFFVALVSMYIFAVKFKQWGLPYLPTVGMFDPKVGKTPAQVALHMVLPIFSIAVISIAGYSRYVALPDAGGDQPGLHPHGPGQGIARTGGHLSPRPQERLAAVGDHRRAGYPPAAGRARSSPRRIFAWPGMGRLFLDHVSRRRYAGA